MKKGAVFRAFTPSESMTSKVILFQTVNEPPATSVVLTSRSINFNFFCAHNLQWLSSAFKMMLVLSGRSPSILALTVKTSWGLTLDELTLNSSMRQPASIRTKQLAQSRAFSSSIIRTSKYHPPVGSLSFAGRLMTAFPGAMVLTIGGQARTSRLSSERQHPRRLTFAFLAKLKLMRILFFSIANESITAGGKPRATYRAALASSDWAYSYRKTDFSSPPDKGGVS
ncbi:MAG: hypothetical protein PHV34_24520 [Verrucomicrobiae bacterium]|nr:hypothetical protein [Verrucomicrobiae bacterium]